MSNFKRNLLGSEIMLFSKLLDELRDFQFDDDGGAFYRSTRVTYDFTFNSKQYNYNLKIEVDNKIVYVQDPLFICQTLNLKNQSYKIDQFKLKNCEIIELYFQCEGDMHPLEASEYIFTNKNDELRNVFL